jgi:hypothetical protein
MKTPRPKKQPKAPAKTKIAGKLSSFNAQRITLQAAKGIIWKIAKAPATKVTGALKLGSKVTVEFSKKNGRRLEAKAPPSKDIGRRTENVGRIIGLTPAQITLDNATPKTATDDPFPGPYIIDRTDVNTVIVTGTLTVGATNVDIVFFEPPSKHGVFV